MDFCLHLCFTVCGWLFNGRLSKQIIPVPEKYNNLFFYYYCLLHTINYIKMRTGCWGTKGLWDQPKCSQHVICVESVWSMFKSRNMKTHCRPLLVEDLTGGTNLKEDTTDGWDRILSKNRGGGGGGEHSLEGVHLVPIWFVYKFLVTELLHNLMQNQAEVVRRSRDLMWRETFFSFCLI